MKPLVIHAGARAEVLTAIAYYDTQREGLGLEFQLELERVFQKIEDMPHSAAAIDKRGTRKRLLNRFPYVVYAGIDLDCRSRSSKAAPGLSDRSSATDPAQRQRLTSLLSFHPRRHMSPQSNLVPLFLG